MSQRPSGFERSPGDQYMTPEWPVKSLLSIERLFGEIWEPACGEGTIAKVICERVHWSNVLATDIDPTFSEVPLDFLTIEPSALFSPKLPLTIITNPPYGKGGKLALAFVNRAIEITRPMKGKVIMLLPVDWDCAKGRVHLFGDFPGLVRKITLTERIRWTSLTQSKAGPSSNHAWFIWDHARKGTAMHWIGRVE